MTSIGTKIVGALLGIGFVIIIGAGVAMAGTPRGGVMDVCKVRKCM